MSERVAASPPRGVVLDCDGVLVDSEPLHARATTEWAATIGIRLEPDFFPGVIGMTVRQQIAKIVGPDRLDSAYRAREAHFWSLLEEIPTVPGIVELVRDLRAAGLALAVASNGTQRYVQHVVEVLGLARCFDALTTADSGVAPKPDPAPYRHSAGQLGLTPEACAAVEDSPLGARSAADAGLRLIVVDHDGAGPTDFPAGAELVADLAGVRRVLLGSTRPRSET